MVSTLVQESQLWNQIAQERKNDPSKYTPEDVKNAERQAEALQNQAKTLNDDLQATRANSIIAQFNDDLREA